ncbi:TMV resistance protein N-like [Castanea sativa]|uniref:TMV resistance protein N-like n=1 Tax=Castanea sativa TaxID=21020 RepID=UPI003F64EB04
MSTQGASTLSPSSSSTPRWTYDVFLSFRGEDTRKNFTDHLYKALKNKGIETFRDDEKLERGKFISQELVKAIEESRFAIVIFSKNYAFSIWCLDELVHIVRCRKEKKLEVFPIFYHVDPSDIRKQKRTFAEAFDKYKENFKESIEMVETWRSSLTEVANLSGWDLQDRHETEFIQDIVVEMWKRLSPKFSRINKNLIGIKSIVKELISSYLDFGNNVCMIGICGMGGIGKTTIAKVVLEMYSDQFEVSSFIADVREKSEKGDLLKLQKQFLEESLGGINREIYNVDHGVAIIKDRLRHKKVLLVLDDVNHVKQLENLAGEHQWFGSGSWIIITTRDEHVLVEHGVLKIYKPNGLNKDDALQLFCSKAFKNEQPKEDYMRLSQEVVNYASGLPLALVTLGSFLIGKKIDEWQSALDYFKKKPAKGIFDILKISYDGLEEEWKEIFLDTACFFKRWSKDEVISILENCGFNARIGISVLQDKSLLTVTGDEENLGMHDLLQEMGEKIVRQQSRGKLGRQSRLWLVEDLFNVLENNMATNAIQAIVIVNNWKAGFNFEEFPEVFSKMSSLRLLIIDAMCIPNALNRVPNGLRHLSWKLCRLKCLPSSFQPKELVGLDLRRSKCEYLWEGAKCLGKLKSIDLSWSKHLIRTPDFSGVARLEILGLEWCTNLVGLHPSIGQLSKLKSLGLIFCESLTNLPSLSANMESLTSLDLNGCPKIKKIPEFKGTMKSLSQLHLGLTGIKELPPSSIECLTALKILDLKDCKNLECLPSNIDSLRSLKILNLTGCSELANLPENLRKIKCLERLELGGISQLEDIILNGIGCLSSLTYLSLSSNNFVTLPAIFSQLSKLEALDLSNCKKLRSVSELPSTLRYINMERCCSLEPLPALLRQSNLSRPYPAPFFRGYDESSGGVAFTILNHYLQGLFCQKLGYETATKRKEDGSKTEFQIIIPGCLVPRWLTHQSWGNSISVVLSPNWCNSGWMGFTICALFNETVYSDWRARVKAIGDMPHSQYVSKFHFGIGRKDHVWLLYLSRDDWFSTVGNGECNWIEVVFEVNSGPTDKVLHCGVSLVYEQDMELMEELNQANAQCCSSSRVITYEVRKRLWSKGNWRKKLFWLFFRWISRKRD